MWVCLFWCMMKIKNKGVDHHEGAYHLGRHRKPPGEVVKAVTINLKLKVIEELEKEGKPKHVIEKMVNDKYLAGILEREEEEKRINDKDSEN